MQIDTFCKIKDIGEADLREHLNIRVEEFKDRLINSIDSTQKT